MWEPRIGASTGPPKKGWPSHQVDDLGGFTWCTSSDKWIYIYIYIYIYTYTYISYVYIHNIIYIYIYTVYIPIYGGEITMAVKKNFHFVFYLHELSCT